MQFPAKQLFGKMSPSLVKQRQATIENYLKEIARDKDLTREPLVRMFFKLPMTAEEAEQLEYEAHAAADPGLLTGCAAAAAPSVRGCAQRPRLRPAYAAQLRRVGWAIR